VLRETTSRGLCGLVCPSRTSERGGEGDCVKEGGGEEGKCERERALERERRSDFQKISGKGNLARIGEGVPKHTGKRGVERGRVVDDGLR
jgi:hypothetical protein